MQDREGKNPVLGIAKEATDAWRANFTGLQVEQARNHLEIVLHPVMNLAKHMIALLQPDPKFGLPAGDRLCHCRHALADRRQFGGPGA